MATTKKPKTPTSETLAAKLARMDALLADKNPTAAKAMAPGVKDVAIRAFRSVLGAPVPDDLATFFRWHDGQSRPASFHAGDNRTPMALEDAIDVWRMLMDPSGAAKQPWKASWVPIFENGAGDYLCFDLRKGALVEYWHTDEDRMVAFASLGAWADATSAALERAKPAKAPVAASKLTLDTTAAKWTKIRKAPTEPQLAEKPIGSTYWYEKPLVEDEPPCMYLFVKVEGKGEKPWRKVENKELALGAAFAHIQAHFDREKAPPDDWWKATDWDVAYACREEALSKDEPSTSGLHEGTIQVRGA